jgi:hypothetical protein
MIALDVIEKENPPKEFGKCLAVLGKIIPKCSFPQRISVAHWWSNDKKASKYILSYVHSALKVEQS